MAPETTTQVENFLMKDDFQFRHIPDADGFLKKFGVGFPKNILVDKTGVIRYIDSGLGGVIEMEEDTGEPNFEIGGTVLIEKMEALLDENVEE